MPQLNRLAFLSRLDITEKPGLCLDPLGEPNIVTRSQSHARPARLVQGDQCGDQWIGSWNFTHPTCHGTSSRMLFWVSVAYDPYGLSS
jgi:hypothetical protein